MVLISLLEPFVCSSAQLDRLQLTALSSIEYVFVFKGWSWGTDVTGTSCIVISHMEGGESSS